MKVLKFVICALAMFMVSTAAYAGSTPVEKPGQGDQNCHHRQSGLDSLDLSCLSAIASKNPVLILDACVSLEAEGYPHIAWTRTMNKAGALKP